MSDQAAGGNQQVQMRFGMQRLYLKDLSFESPNAPMVFTGQWKPKLNLDLNTRHEHIQEDLYEVILALTIRAEGEDGKTGYIIEVQQAGIFQVGGLESEQTEQVLATACPAILLPYARETVDSLAVKGSFPPVMLAPVNFDQLYAQAKQSQAGKDDSVKH